MPKKFVLVGGLSCFAAMSAFALDEVGLRYVKMFANGGPSSIRSAAESIYNTANSDQEVLDAAAEALLTNYRKNPTSEYYADAMAWLCRALGNSNNARYQPVVAEVAAKAEGRKVKRYCERAAKDLPKSGAEPYIAGSFDLSQYKEGAAPVAAAAPAAPAAAAAPAAPAAAGKGFSVVKEGMSKEEVEALIGVPTAVTSHITGKAWRPFNFKGSDTHRIIALYKGVGRIIYSNSSAYTSTYRVMEIIEDPSESGYP
ncbi:MAG TPA: hypothetical protein VIL28_07405 [Steroidobacteraceae bacterium]